MGQLLRFQKYFFFIIINIIFLVTLLTISSNRLCTFCSNNKLQNWLRVFGHVMFSANDGLLSFSVTTVTLVTQYLSYVEATCEHVREQRCRIKHSFGQSDT